MRLCAALALGGAAVLLGGCTSSGNGTPSGSLTSGLASSPATAPPSTPASSSPLSASSSAPASTPSSSSAAGKVDCAAVTTDASFGPIAIFTPGGSLPSGVPLPQAVPVFTCKATANHERVSLVAASWTAISDKQYEATLTQTGWTSSKAGALLAFHKDAAKYTIVIGTVQGQLVAVYGPPS